MSLHIASFFLSKVTWRIWKYLTL